MLREAEGWGHWQAAWQTAARFQPTCRARFQLTQLRHRLLVLQSQQGAAAAQQTAALQAGEGGRQSGREGGLEGGW